jgi:hypothetical protein
VFEDKVAASEWGRQFMEEAESRGSGEDAVSEFKCLVAMIEMWGTCFMFVCLGCMLLTSTTSSALHCNLVEGLNGIERLRKTVFEFSFAGFGGDGPGGKALEWLWLGSISASSRCSCDDEDA